MFPYVQDPVGVKMLVAYENNQPPNPLVFKIVDT